MQNSLYITIICFVAENAEITDEKVKATTVKTPKTQDKIKMKRTTRFVIVMCLVYFTGNVFNSIGFFIYWLLRDHFAVFTIVSNTLLFSSQACSLFVYYKFNSNFRVEFNKLFCSCAGQLIRPNKQSTTTSAQTSSLNSQSK